MTTAAFLPAPPPVVNPATVPSATTLGYEGRLFLLSWLHADLCSGLTITADSWRDAWGRAADYQTVVDGRKYLATVTP